MGGAIAALLAAENNDLQALVLIAPYFDMSLNYRLASALYWIWGPIAGTLISQSPDSIHDPVERSKNLGQGVYTGRLLYELWRVAHRGRVALPYVRVPTLLIQSKEDPRVAESVAKDAFASLGSAEKRLVWIEHAGHVITVDFGRERVFQEMGEWLDAHMPAEEATT